MYFIDSRISYIRELGQDWQFVALCFCNKKKTEKKDLIFSNNNKSVLYIIKKGQSANINSRDHTFIREGKKIHFK